MNRCGLATFLGFVVIAVIAAAIVGGLVWLLTRSDITFWFFIGAWIGVFVGLCAVRTSS